MISKYTLKVINNFGRLVKPKLSKNESIFQLMKDKSYDLKTIQRANLRNLTFNKLRKPQQIIAEDLGVSQKCGLQILNTEIHTNAYSPIWMKPYRISQKFNQDIKIQQNVNSLQIPYDPTHSNLKYHYSINKAVPIIYEYKINKSTAYIFNLPQQVDQKQLLMEIGYRTIKNLKVHYCMLGLPAFAQIQFNSQNKLAQLIHNKQLEIRIADRLCVMCTDAHEAKMKLDRRQLVIKGLQEYQTPSSVLQKFSLYGRVMNLDFPMQVYRQPSIKQIKQIYKNQKSPICINYHRKNGTIQSEYYPPFQPSKYSTSFVEQKQAQYKRRLKYCENVHVYQGKQGTITKKPKGFAIVTFSCQDEAQNCYLQLSTNLKMELLNGRQQFEFDDKHRQALLRFIDNSYIQKCVENNPSKLEDDQAKKLDSIYFQSLYLNMTLKNYLNETYFTLKEDLISMSDQNQIGQYQYEYRKHLNGLKQTVGLGNINPNISTNKYGKSFDELAQEQLYGMKLKQKSKNPRYQVNIDDYIKQTPAFVPQSKKRIKSKSQQDFEQGSQVQVKQGGGEGSQNDQLGPILREESLQLSQNLIVEQGEEQQVVGQSQESKQKIGIGKKGFSTTKNIQLKQLYRPKTTQQVVKSHMNYNKFVRDLINQYMGIFSVDKLESELFRKKPKYVNLQSLKFSDGTQFITEQDVKNVLQYSTNIQDAQNFYQNFIRENQISKSLEIDLEQSLLKDFNDNESQMLYHYSDVGVIKQQYNYQGKDINKALQKLNMEAEFGQQYKIVQNEDGTKKIVKLAKLQNIYPIQIIQRLKNYKQKLTFDPKKVEAISKYSDYIFNGKPIPDELAQAFGLQKNTILDQNELSEQTCQQLGIRKKDLQKLLNLSNYTPEQLGEDFENQKKKLRARERRAPNKASDYGKDPSQIKVKDKEGKAVVSKFRQI